MPRLQVSTSRLLQMTMMAAATLARLISSVTGGTESRSWYESVLTWTQRKYFSKLKIFSKTFHPLQGSFKTVSRILHHIHRCLIYEAIMRHFRDKYEAIMKQISIFYTKNEVLGAAIFVHCQTTLKL